MLSEWTEPLGHSDTGFSHVANISWHYLRPKSWSISIYWISDLPPTVSSPHPSLTFSSSSRNILDDFREAYYWLRQNTDEHARVMSWWDYGYQIAGMANRTTLVDNNTWNNSHIALVRAAVTLLTSFNDNSNLWWKGQSTDFTHEQFSSHEEALPSCLTK